MKVINEYEKLVQNNKTDQAKEPHAIKQTKSFIKDQNIESTLGTTEESKKNFKNDYSILQEEITKLKNLNSEYKSKNEKLTKDLKSFRNDNKKLYDHNKQINYSFNNKLTFHEKEILFFKNLILKILNFISCDNIRKLIEQILEANNFISEFEIERLKLDKNFEKYENELKAFLDKENNNLENSELYSELKLKVANSKDKVIEINRKIQDKKQEILVLESKINKEKEIGNCLEKKNDNSKNSNESENKEFTKNSLFEKFAKMQKNNFVSNENNNERNRKEELIIQNKPVDNLQESEDEEQGNYNYNNNDDVRNYLEKENSFENNEIDNENNFFRIENNTINQFFNNNKATNVFKKNYVDSNKNAELEKNYNNTKIKNYDISDNHSDKSSVKKEEEKIFSEKNTNKLNFEYKINPIHHKKPEYMNQNNPDYNSKKDELALFEEGREYKEEKNFYNRNKQNFNSKKSDGISIDTDKINEKYDKLLNKVAIEAAGNITNNNNNNKHEADCILKDRNLEYKLKDQLRPFSAVKSEANNLIKDKHDFKKSEVPKALETKRDKHNLNLNYENLYSEVVENKILTEEKPNVKENKNNTKNKNNDFDYKRSLNSERNNKKESKRTFKNVLSDDVDKFGKSPEKLNSKKIEPAQIKSDLNENPIGSNKDNYGCNNNFTFNNNEETENSIESKSSRKLNKNVNEDFAAAKNDMKDNKGEAKNIEHQPSNFNDVPKKRGFGRRNFDIDI